MDAPDAASPEDRAGRRAPFDRFVAREYAGLLAEAVVLVDDHDQGARVLRRALRDARRTWAHHGGHGDPADLVRDAVVARAARLDHHGPRPPTVASPRPATLAALAALPGVQRRALVLHHVLGRTVEQVAADTGAAVPTVRRRLTHGAWALASRHPDAVTVPRPGAASSATPSGPSVVTSPIEHWAAIELGTLRRTLAARGHPRPTAAASPVPRRTLARTLVTVAAVLVLAILGAAWADLSHPPASPQPTPSAAVPADVVAR